ncbi:hypothetical protein [Paenibacillus sp. KN14-4R]|uniref:hypothetical protein n=1 Tax=Paenibacillus sp. KN14-4R TaxID=3445773 RepID=UPI003FA01F3F
MSTVSYMALALFIFLLYRSYQAYQGKKKAGEILLSGSSNGGYYFLGIYPFPLIWVMSTEREWSYLIIGCLIMIAAGYISGVYLGESGLKINGRFIAKDQILHYRIIEGTVNEVEFQVRGKDDFRVKFTKKTSSSGLETVLNQFLHGDTSTAGS